MTQKIKTVKKKQHNKHKEECSLFEGFKRETHQQIRLHSMNYGMGGGTGSICQEGIGTLQTVRQGTFTHSATALTDSLLIMTKIYLRERKILKTPHRRQCKRAGFSVQHQPNSSLVWEKKKKPKQKKKKKKKKNSLGVISLDDGGGFISMAPIWGFSAVHQRNHKVMPEEGLKTRR